MFKNSLLFLKLLLLLFMVSECAYSQDSLTTSIAKKLALYKLSKSPSTLFLHFDKTIYTTAEDVWFTAYQLRSTRNIKEYHTLSVALVREEDRLIVAQDKFLIEDGLAFGFMRLSFDLSAGNYSFIAYTNIILNGKPEEVFVQPVTIKTKDPNPFLIKLSPAPVKSGADSVSATLEAYSKTNTLLKDASIRFRIGEGSVPKLEVSGKTNIKGEYRVSFPSYAVRDGANTLSAIVVSGIDTSRISAKLAVTKEEATVHFYPEGGHLVENLVSNVGWEAKNPGGEPLQLAGILYRNEELIDTVRTSSSGMGKFTVIPGKGDRYSVGINLNGKQVKFPLPVPLKAGTVLTMTNPLSGDTLNVRLRSTATRKIKLLVHNFQQGFASVDVDLQAFVPRTIKVLLNELPRGLATITALDSTGRPLAERIFFAHYAKTPALTIQPDSNEYGVRGKVTIKLKLDSLALQGTGGTFSIACVQDNRLELIKLKRIDSYYYLDQELMQPPIHPSGRGLSDPEYLNQVLLIRGWRKYSWQDLMNVKAADTVKTSSPMIFSGSVTLEGKKLLGSIQLAGMAGTRPLSLSTDKKGGFTFETEDLITPAGRPVLVMPAGGGKFKYAISVNDPYPGISKSTADTLPLESYTLKVPSARISDLTIARNERANEMKEVLLFAGGKDYSLYINKCGDYVCKNNALNCPRHPPAALPVKGKEYLVQDMREYKGLRLAENDAGMYAIYDRLQLIKYAGCSSGYIGNFFSLGGIYTQKEFYPIDYSGPDSLEQKYVSTLFWQHSVVLNSKKETELSFYTGDIPGRYRIVVQGVVPGDVVYGESYFEVKKKK